MKHNSFSRHVARVTRRLIDRAHRRRLHRHTICDPARLSNHMLKDIGWHRDGAWVGFDINR